jgi:hypothetical protein
LENYFKITAFIIDYNQPWNLDNNPAQKSWQESCQDSCDNFKDCSKVWVPHCTAQKMYTVLEKSCKICISFLQEISKKSRKNLAKNLARFLLRFARSCKSWQDSCKNLVKIFEQGIFAL